MIKKLTQKIDAFLSTKVKVEKGNERAKADADDIKKLEDIIQLLCEAKWEPSYDGFVPVQIKLINRSTHENFDYAPQPYIADGANPETSFINFEEKMSIATLNSHLACAEVERVWRTQKSALHRVRAIKENRYCRMHGEYHKKKESDSCPHCKKREA